MRIDALPWVTVTHHQVRDVPEDALHEHGPDARALAGVVAELVPSEYREVAYEDVYGMLRTAMWPADANWQ